MAVSKIEGLSHRYVHLFFIFCNLFFFFLRDDQLKLTSVRYRWKSGAVAAAACCMMLLKLHARKSCAALLLLALCF